MLVCMYVLTSVFHLSICANLTYYMEENKSLGTFIGDIANDIIDSVFLHNQSSLAFFQVEPGVAEQERLFSLSRHDGKLYTARTLDAESLCSFNVECFQILDVAVYRLDTLLEILEIKVVIHDTNDHSPVFPDHWVTVEFSEGNGRGTRKPLPNAVDRDVGYFNAQVKYSLRKIHDEPFSLLVSKGLHGMQLLSLMLQGELDREIKDSYLVQVVARDGGSPPLENVLDVHISVLDINDNSPIFTRKIYNVSVSNKPNNITPIAIISASDSDLGQNSEIVYRLLSKTLTSAKLYFKVDPNSGEIFLRKKVPQKEAYTYKLYIEARDKGRPSLSAVTKVIVHLVGKKNKMPVIDVKFVFASVGNIVEISEDAKIGSFVAYVMVSDQDVGKNGEVDCDLHHDLFQLENLGTKKYKIILKSVLDRETRSSHNVTFTCQDRGLPPLKSEWTFSVQVMDINDVQPQFSQHRFGFWIHENQKPNFPVGFINVTDPDLGSGHELSYSLLTSSKYFLPFQITKKGFISAVSSLDREVKDVYKFQVLVSDNGSPSLNNTAAVVVEVKDENDNAPYFIFPSVNPYKMDVTYYPYHTKNITQIKASDRDIQENAFLKYEIIRGNSKQIFSINQYTGLLSSTHILNQQDAGSYELELLVKDSGSSVLSARTTIYLTLIVSNKTTFMASSDEKKQDIELHIVISIGIVTVTISVVLTVFLLACLIQHYEQRDKLSKEQRDYAQRLLKRCSYSMYPRQASTMTQATDFILRDGAASMESRGRMKTTHGKADSGSARIAKLQDSLENICEMHGTEGYGTPVDRIKNEDACVGLECLARDSESSSETELKHDWVERNKKHDRVLQDSCSRQRGLCLGAMKQRRIKNPKLQNVVNEETVIFSRQEMTSSEMLPTMRQILYPRPEFSSQPLSIASLYHLSQSFHGENFYTAYQQQTLPITRL